MKHVGIENQFVWPEIEDTSWFEMDSVVCLIESPITIAVGHLG